MTTRTKNGKIKNGSASILFTFKNFISKRTRFYFRAKYTVHVSHTIVSVVDVDGPKKKYFLKFAISS